MPKYVDAPRFIGEFYHAYSKAFGTPARSLFWRASHRNAENEREEIAMNTTFNGLGKSFGLGLARYAKSKYLCANRNGTERNQNISDESCEKLEREMSSVPEV